MPRRLLKVPPSFIFCRPTGKWHFARHRVVKRATQRIDVTDRCDVLGISYLFRRQIVGGSDHLTVPRVTLVVGHEGREAKIGNLAKAIGRHQNISRLDISMNQVLLVRIREPLGGLLDDVRGLLDRQSTTGANQPAKIGAWHIFDHQIVNITIFARIISTHQVGMIEFGLHANFPHEALDRMVGGFAQWQDLDGANSPHHLMFRLEDLAHTPLADPVLDQVAAERKLGSPGDQLVDLIRSQNILGNQIGTQITIRNFIGSTGLMLFTSNDPRDRFPDLRIRQKSADHRGFCKNGLCVVLSSH